MKAITDYDTALFWSKVDVRWPGECWMWRGAANQEGYGAHKVGGRQVRAHRFAWMIAHPGETIDPGLMVCHHCDTPGCCNPSHLFIGTPAANTQDMLRKGRGGGILGSADGARAGQERGAATRRRRTVEQRFPALLRDIADRITSGQPTTYRSIARLDGYWAARKTLGLTHRQIVEEARKCAV